MELIREYLLSVTAAALLCGIMQSFAGEKTSSAGILRLVCGIFLSFTVIRPIADIQFKEISVFPSDIMADAKSTVEEGEDYARRAMARLIKEEAEAYILDKARSLGAELSVDVTVSNDEPPVPMAVTLIGQVSPYVKQQLMRTMETDLGIPEEDQQWKASNSSS